MDKESIIELQKIDCNCNDCKFMDRDFEKMKSYNRLHEGQEKASFRINYGNCSKFKKTVSFIPNTCQLDTQDCFQHRRDGTTVRFLVKKNSKEQIVNFEGNPSNHYLDIYFEGKYGGVYKWWL